MDVNHQKTISAEELSDSFAVDANGNLVIDGLAVEVEELVYA